MSPLPRSLAVRNKKYLNRVARHVAPHLPYFALLGHRGRRTGREYEIPVNVFRRGDAYVFALTYGSEADWVRNVLATSTATLRRRGRRVTLVEPVLRREPTVAWAPPFVRFLLRRMRVYDSITMTPAKPGSTSPVPPPGDA